MKDQNKPGKMIRGISFSFMIAVIAIIVESVLPVEFIGSTVIAIFIGVFINYFFPVNQTSLNEGVRFTAKRVLKLAIILLGGSLNISTIVEVGQMAIVILAFTLSTAFILGFFIGKIMNQEWEFTSLISSGSAICGGSAISAVAPAVGAKDYQIAYAISNVFLFDLIMIILFPLLGQWLNLTDISYGLWAGTSINDTSSVVAAGYAFSESAGDFATMVKLTRTLAIIPTVIVFTFIPFYLNRKHAKQRKETGIKMEIFKVFPWFIIGFLILVLLNSLGYISPDVANTLREISKFLMVVALSAIGLRTNISEMKHLGIGPLLQSFITSSAVVMVSITVQYLLNFI